jgi:hypothetical protein
MEHNTTQCNFAKLILNKWIPNYFQ